MRRRRNKDKHDKGSPRWMVTYSDMVTLILVFFILLFSMSQLDLVKFEAISDSFKNREILDFLPSAVELDENGQNGSSFNDGLDDEDSSGIDDESFGEGDSLEKLLTDVNRFLDENALNDVISADRTERGVVLVLQESILFDSAEAEILNRGKPFLEKIGTLLVELPNYVKVEGHTDSRPISNYRYPSNWELSGARASSVIRYLIDENDFKEDRFSAVGYSDTRPAVPNTNNQNLGKNRRVEIVILEDGQSEGMKE